MVRQRVCHACCKLKLKSALGTHTVREQLAASTCLQPTSQLYFLLAARWPLSQCGSLVSEAPLIPPAGDTVAIKQMSLSGISQENLQSVMGEIELLRNLNHKNIVKYLGSFKTRTHLHIILEYMENGSLASIIKPNKFGAFPESLVAVYIAQVSLHSPQNIELALLAQVKQNMGHISGPFWPTWVAWPSQKSCRGTCQPSAGQGLAGACAWPCLNMQAIAFWADVPAVSVAGAAGAGLPPRSGRGAP